MIPRILVPQNVQLAATGDDAARPRRLSTALDSRTLVPHDLPVVTLDGKTSIPAHIPLEVLGSRTVVPRGVSAAPLQITSAIPGHLPLTVLDTRLVVPKDAQPAPLLPRGPIPAYELLEVLEPDVLTTGEVHLLNKPVEERVSGWGWQAKASSILFHACFLVLLLLQPKLFPPRPPTQAELDLARQQLGFIYLPPSVTDVPKVPPRPEPSSPLMRIDPRVLRQVAPPNAEPEPLPGPKAPERVVRELPAAPTPQLPGAQEQKQRGDAPKQMARFEAPKAAGAPAQLTLPQTSPGKALEDSLRGAAQGRGGGMAELGGPMGPSPGGGGGQGLLGETVEMLTPTEGVDFSNYLARVLASVKRNWYAVIPESARLGERGRVMIEFRILRDGSVPYPEPVLVSTSSKEPLDRAAMSSIRASSPFEPLPPAFRGPFIALRFTFLYNLPLNYR